MSNEQPTHRTHRELTSAGGVAVRDTSRGHEVALVLIEPEMRWQLPKGLVDAGETVQQAALREVSEEAGITCEIVAPIQTIDYWFTSHHDADKIRVHKHVHFFLMKYVSGDVADHDHEVAEARWFPVKEAFAALAFDSERSVLLLGVDMLTAHAAGGK